MTSVNEISAEEVMEKEPVKAQNDHNIHQVKNLMEEHDLRAVPVVDSKGNLEGAVGYRDLVRHVQFNPSQAKLGKVMHQPPVFESTDSLVDLAELRINSGRKMMVYKEGEKLSGVVGDQEFLEAMDKADELENLETDTLATEELETVFEEDTLEQARHLMLDRNISRLPVLDKNGKMTGMLRSTDLLRMMVPREVQSAGGTSGNRSGNEVNIAGGSEKERMSQVTVEELMEREFFKQQGHLKCSEAVEKMLEEDSHEIVFVDESYPQSIITLKDFIDYVSDFAPGSTVLVNLIGLDLPEEKSAVHNAVRKQLQGSLGRKLSRPEELSIRVKKAEKDGKKHRWELDMKLYSEFGVTAVNEDGWDLLDAVDEALGELNEIVRRKKEKQVEERNS